MAITAAQVNELRQKTGVGMMECKKALTACEGNLEAAIEYLRKSGIAKAAKKAGRSATEGKFAVASRNGVTAMVEVLCETDFVAKTAEFTALANAAAEKALSDFTEEGDISAKLAELMSDDLKILIAKLGENMHIRRALRWQAGPNCQIGTYLHTGVPYGVMVEVAGDCDAKLLNNICLHVCASNPAYIAPENVPADLIAKEKEIAAAQPKLQGKPAKMLEGILNGMINKWFGEICLVCQPWIEDDKTTLAKAHPGVSVKRYVRFQAGEELPGEAKEEA